MRFSDRLEQSFEALLADHPERRTALVPMLKVAQKELGFVADETLREIAARIDLPVEDAENIAGFFSFKRQKPASRYTLQVCVNINCKRRGGDAVLERCKATLGVGTGEITADRIFSLQEIVCLGMCESGPALRVDRERFDGMTPDAADALLARLRADAEGWS